MLFLKSGKKVRSKDIKISKDILSFKNLGSSRFDLESTLAICWLVTSTKLGLLIISLDSDKYVSF